MRRDLLCVLVFLGGCQRVEVEFAPAPRTDSIEYQAQLRHLAEQGFEFVVPTKTVLVVAPLDELGLSSSAPKVEAGSTPVAAPATPAAAPTAKPAPSTLGTRPVPRRKAAEDVAKSHVTTDSGVDALAIAALRRKTWAAIALPVADYENAFFVRGVSGFWAATTLALGRYPNTDRVSSLAIKAENFVPKRIQEIAGIATSVIEIAALAVSDESDELQPFKLELPDTSVIEETPLQPHWGYTLEYQPSDRPTGTVPMAAGALPAGKVNYWPVPACQVAKLTLMHQDLRKVFYVTVAAPDRYRLQPLPVSGKVDLGSICGASVSDAAAADPLVAASDSAAAVLGAARKFKSASARLHGASSPATVSGH